MTLIYSYLSTFSDPTRSRILYLLEKHELSVSELCSIVQLPQSTVSRHLKVLVDQELVYSRADGTSRRYRMVSDQLQSNALQLWEVVRNQLSELPTASQDLQRLEIVLSNQNSTSQKFFSTAAGHWDRMRSELFGVNSDIIALLGLFDPSWTIADLGCGTGHISALLSPFVKNVIAIDDSAQMLEAANSRLQQFKNVVVKRGDLSQLPIDTESVDVALIFFVLHYLPDPATIIIEASRALKPNGRLLVVDLTPHDRDEFKNTMGHIWQGFSSDDVSSWADIAGLTDVRYHKLPPDPAAKGPSLFAASAQRPAIYASLQNSVDAALQNTV